MPSITHKTKLAKIAIILWLFSILAMAVLMFTSCGRKQTIHSSTTQTIIKDSIYLVETIKYDTLIIPADTLVQSVYIECDSVTNKPKPFNALVKSNHISNSLILDNTGKLTSASALDSLLHIIATKERELYKWQALAYTQEDKETVFVKYIPKFYKYCFAIAITIIGLTTLKYILKWRKIINPLW